MIEFKWDKINDGRFRYLDTEHPSTNKMLQLYWRLPDTGWEEWQDSRYFIQALYTKEINQRRPEMGRGGIERSRKRRFRLRDCSER